MRFFKVMKGRGDAYLASGDFMTGEVDGVAVEKEVYRAAPGYVQLVSDVPTFSTDATMTFVRGFPYRETEVSYDLTRRVNEGYTANILCSYVALRKDLSLQGPVPLSSYDDIDDAIGLQHPSNPLGLGCDMYLRGQGGSTTNVFYALATDGTSLADYKAALDTLQSEDMYCLVPLTNDPEILDLFTSHVQTQSQPENKHERIVVMSYESNLIDSVIPADPEDNSPVGQVNSSIDTQFETATPATIEWASVRPGMVIKIMNGAGYDEAVIEERRIKEVNPAMGYATTLTAFTTTPGSDVYFRIETYPKTVQEEAEAWGEEARSIGSDRVIMVRPDNVQIVYTDKTGTRTTTSSPTTVPGYYLAAVIAGVKRSRGPQDPITNVGVPGIRRVTRSDNYFTPDQLNTIAGGGNLIVIQPTRTASPSVRHQLTTDMTAVETREWSIREAIDFTAKTFRDNYRPFIGNRNLTQEVLNQLRGVGERIISALVEDGVVDQGSKLLALYQDQDQPDSVIVEVNLEVLYPCNGIFVKLFI